MKLYVVRHAIAEDRAASGRDADRALTDEGKARMRKAADGLRALDVTLDLLLTSPYRRAVETAEIVAAALGGVEIHPLAELSAGTPLEPLLSALKKHAGLESLGIVGHEPDLGFLASHVMTGSRETCPLAFKKGAVACLEIDGGRADLRGQLEWFLAPRHLRALGGGRD